MIAFTLYRMYYLKDKKGGTMNKNKLLSFVAILSAFLLILPVTAPAEESESLQLAQGQVNQSHIKFGFRLAGGAALLMRNDFNDHLQSYNDLIDDISYISADSEFEMIKMGTDFGGEILISFLPHFSIGIGAGYLSAGKETAVELDIYGIYTEELSYHPKFSVIPITFSLYYGIPVGSFMEVMLNAGFGYYLGTVDFDVYYKDTSGGMWSEETETWSAKSNALGFHGGIDLEFGIARNLALVVGAKGRYAKLTDLTGDLDYEFDTSYGFSGSGTEEDLTLWYGNEDNGAGKEYPFVYLEEKKPTASWLHDVRKAEVNLSGIVFQAGIKVFF